MSKQKTIKYYSHSNSTKSDYSNLENNLIFVNQFITGIPVIPRENAKEIIRSPIEGKIKFVSSSKNYLILTTKDKKSFTLFIKLNIDEANKKAFYYFVKKGEYVKKGQKLLEVNFSTISAVNRVKEILFFENK